MNFGFNEITNDGVTELATSLATLKNLTSLNLDLRYNNIKTDGAVSLGEALSKLVLLSNLNLNLGGYSV